MQRLLLFLTTSFVVSFVVKFFIWIPLRFVFLRFFGLYVGDLVFNLFGGLLFFYCLERFFVLFQEDDGRGIIGVFIPEWVEKPATIFFWKVTRPLRKKCFIIKYGYLPKN